MANKESNQSKRFPPVISVLGHVDHGKTTLLDKIRKSNIARGEKGGITQSIGASNIEVMHDGEKRQITLIDTPGHEAFANMRAQGVSAADLALLVVAADDGVKPQTKEALDKIKEAKIPFIVVFTKIDTQGANVKKAQQEVMSQNVLLEGMGGDVPHIGVSGVTGENVQELLDLIILVHDLAGLEKDENADFLGVIIDAKTDKRKGITASVIVKAGKLNLRDDIFANGENVGRVKAMVSPSGKGQKEALPGSAIELLGIQKVLKAGTALMTKEEEVVKAEDKHPDVRKPKDLLAFFEEEKKQTFPIVVKTQTSAEMEALKNALTEEVKIVHEGQGDITTSDVLLAKDFDAVVMGFNVGINNDAEKIAQSEQIFYKTYTIIYELLDEIQDAVQALMESGGKRILGRAEILAKFESADGEILGMRVTEGRLSVNDKVTLVRKDEEIAEAKISSLKSGKKDVKEIGKGNECGAKLDTSLDFKIGDVILSHK